MMINQWLFAIAVSHVMCMWPVVFSKVPSSQLELARSKQEAYNLSQTINSVLKGYDLKVRPNAGGKPCDVVVEIKVVSFGELKESMMEFSMDIFFRQWWYDPRFKHNYTTPFTMAYDATKLFWTPDTYFVNVKHSKYHHVTRSNMRVMIHGDGKIYFSTRITLTAQCDMDFRLYPMDTQECRLIIESYAYTRADVDYSWKKSAKNGIETVSEQLAQFDIVAISTRTKDIKNSKGSFASLQAVFSFRRRLEFFIFSIFTPAVILVILSWCCFWIKDAAVPARVSLAVTTILTTIVVSSTVNRNMPKVSYMKAVDYFLLTNFGFIFLSFLEYVLVLNSEPNPEWFRTFTCSLQALKTGRTDAEDNDGDISIAAILTNNQTDRSRTPETENNPKLATIQVLNDPVVTITTTMDGKDPVLKQRRVGSRSEAPVGEPHKKKPAQNAPAPVHWVDKVSRVLFPVAYGIFIAGYWMYFLNQAALEQPTEIH